MLQCLSYLEIYCYIEYIEKYIVDGLISKWGVLEDRAMKLTNLSPSIFEFSHTLILYIKLLHRTLFGFRNHPVLAHHLYMPKLIFLVLSLLLSKIITEC